MKRMRREQQKKRGGIRRRRRRGKEGGIVVHYLTGNGAPGADIGGGCCCTLRSFELLRGGKEKHKFPLECTAPPAPLVQHSESLLFFPFSLLLFIQLHFFFKGANSFVINKE
jgi:hypothetical protein